MGDSLLNIVIVGGIIFVIFNLFSHEKSPTQKHTTSEVQRAPDKGIVEGLKEWMIKHTPAK